MVSNPGVAANMFTTLKEEDIHIKMVSTSEIKVSVVIDRLHLVTGVEARINHLWRKLSLSCK